MSWMARQRASRPDRAMPLRDPDATIAPIMQPAQPQRPAACASCRPPHGRKAARAAANDDHVEREVVGVLEHPADRAHDARAVADQVDAARVVEDGAERDVAAGDHQQPRQPLDPLRRRERVDHQHEDQDHLRVHVRERGDGAARARSENGAVSKNDPAECEDTAELRRKAGDRLTALQPPEEQRAERRDRGKLRPGGACPAGGSCPAAGEKKGSERQQPEKAQSRRSAGASMRQAEALPSRGLPVRAMSARHPSPRLRTKDQTLRHPRGLASLDYRQTARPRRRANRPTTAAKFIITNVNATLAHASRAHLASLPRTEFRAAHLRMATAVP